MFAVIFYWRRVNGKKCVEAPAGFCLLLAGAAGVVTGVSGVAATIGTAASASVGVVAGAAGEEGGETGGGAERGGGYFPQHLF